MKQQASELRRRAASIGAAKRLAAEEDTRAHLALDPGERLLITLRHCDAAIMAFPDHLDDPRDEEVATWLRVRRHLQRLG